MEHTERESAVSARLSRRTVVAVLGAVASGALLGVERVAAAPAAAPGLDDPAKKEIAMQLVSSAENSSLDWKAQYKYIEDIGDGRGYTAGIIGFCSGTGDMLDLVQLYTDRKPGNVLAKYLPALRRVNGSDSHSGLDPNYPKDWRKAAQDAAFQQAQNDERDRVYFNPAVAQGKTDGLRALGQFAYYDAIVMHGDGDDPTSFRNIRKRALRSAKPPAQGGNETTYLNAFLDARVWAMKQEEAHSDTSRVDTEQRVFLRKGNLDLNTPLDWKVYGDGYHIG
ncbi:chitosanase [Streptomyces sp. NPDC101165]|uniref:chitosanase n=1 Tax=Streptomyces sp. NPDC101165 TaxID=3366119 RepID=UPI00382DF00C